MSPKSNPNEMDAIYSSKTGEGPEEKVVNDVPILIESDSDDDEPSVTRVSKALRKNNVNLIPVQKGRYTGGAVQRSFKAQPLQFGDRGFKSNQNIKYPAAKIQPIKVGQFPQNTAQLGKMAMNSAMARARAKIAGPQKTSYSIDELRNLNKIIRVLVIQNGLHWKCFFCKEMYPKKVDCENHIRDNHLADENSKETEYIRKNFGFVTKPRPVQAAPIAPVPMKTMNSARQTAMKQLQNLRGSSSHNRPIVAKPKFECEHCGWELDEKTVKMKPNNRFDCDSCGFESVKKMKNVAPVNALSSYYAKQKENSAINQRVKNNIRMAQFTNAKKTKLAEMKLSANMKNNGFNSYKAPPKLRNAGRFDYQMDNSPGGLLASLYGQGWPQQQTEENPLYSSVEETHTPDPLSEEKETEEKEKEKESAPEEEDLTAPPKVWGSAESGGFPAGWHWKVASVWSRRIKFRSPEGKVFNARIGAVNYMREQGTYTEEQIKTANDFDQEAVKSEPAAHNTEPVIAEQMDVDSNEALRNNGEDIEDDGGDINEDVEDLKDYDVVGNLVDNMKEASELDHLDDDDQD